MFFLLRSCLFGKGEMTEGLRVSNVSRNGLRRGGQMLGELIIRRDDILLADEFVGR